LEAVLKSEKSNVGFIQERGIQIFAMENPKVFSDRMQVVYKDAADRIGSDIVEQARRFAESA
jgi:TRAP-type C4-dicarboxylate transport system substrate-binding protein